MDDMTISEIKERIGKLLQNDGPLWINQIHHRLGCPIQKVVIAIDELKKEGKIRSIESEITAEEIRNMMVVEV